MPPFRTAHFSEDEKNVACPCCGISNVAPELFQTLEVVRAVVGPIRFNSVCRCERHNAEVGGKPSSAHVTTPTRKAQAADIPCEFARERFRLIKAALGAGINRIGIGEDFVHLDVSETNDSDVLWTYPKGAKA